MSGSDLVPPTGSEEHQEGADSQPSRTPVERKARDPFEPDGMPLALLEFHSPSAALVNLPPTASARYIIWLIGALFMASFTAMGTMPINEVVDTPGRLISSEATVVVQPLETAIIRKIDVRVGDYVHKGQVLAHLDPTISTADLTNMRLQSEAYQAEVDRLRAEADGREYKPDLRVKSSVDEAAAFERRRQEYDAKIAQFDGEIASLQSELQGDLANAAMYGSRARVASQVLQMRQSLQKEQVGSRLNTLGAQGDLMDSERNQVAAQNAAGAVRARLLSTQAEKRNYTENWKAEIYNNLSQAQHRLDEAVSDFEKARLRGSLIELRAQSDAVVLTVSRLSIGSVATPAQVLFTLVPTGYALEVEADLRGQDVGFVHIGDHALIKFTTFPFTQFGGAEGTVRVISADAFGNDASGGDPSSDGGRQTAQQTAEGPALPGYYRVRVRIDRYTLHGVPDFFHPLPGMPTTASINVGKRTMLRYFFNRMIPAATNGMREPS